MARTLIGAMVSRSPATAIVNRTCSNFPIWCEESAFVSAGAPAGWHYGVGRCHYEFMNNPWNTVPSGTGANDSRTFISGNAQADFECNRLPIITTKSAGATWAQVAAGAEDALIDARGIEIAAWQTAHRGLGKWGATFVWSFHHEPNNDIAAQGGTLSVAAANHRAAMRRIYERWVALGVTIWVGGADWSTQTEGLILSLNLIDGGASGARGGDKGTWWGPVNGAGAGDAWMDEHCVMYATDPYPGGPSLVPMSFLMQTTQASGATPIKQWSDAKRAYQATQGRVFMPGIFETGVKQIAQYTTLDHPSWVATGLAPTEANWILNMHDYFRDTYPEMNIVAYWDDRATGFYDVDATPAKFAAVVSTFTDTDTFASAATPLPTGSPLGTTARENDSAQAVKRIRRRTIGIASENDRAQAVTATLKGAKVAQLTTETDTAGSATPHRLSPWSGVAAATTFNSVFQRVIAPASENDSASRFPFRIRQVQGIETNEAEPVTAQALYAWSEAVEATTLKVILPAKVIALALAAEDDGTIVIQRGAHGQITALAGVRSSGIRDFAGVGRVSSWV